MSHELEIVNGQARMLARSNVTPWHGLGSTLADGATIDDVCRDLKIENYELADVVVRLAGGKLIADPSRKAVVRPSDGMIYEYMSDNYKIHQPRKMLEFFRDFFDAGQMRLETIGFLGRGNRMWVLAALEKSITLGTGDVIEAYVLGSTTFDGSGKTIFTPTSVCVVCANTERMALSDVETGRQKNAVAIRHTSELTADVIRAAQATMGLAVEQFDTYSEFVERAAKTAVPHSAPQLFSHYLSNDKLRMVVSERAAEQHCKAGQILLDMMIAADSSSHETAIDAIIAASEFNAQSALSRVGAAILDSIINSPGHELDTRAGTLWGLHSGVTHYVDHVAGRQRDTALESAWFGPGQRMKAESIELVQEMLEAR